MLYDETLRKCRVCDKPKSAAEYPADRRRHGSARCIECRKAEGRVRSAGYYAENKPKMLARFKATYLDQKAQVFEHYGMVCECCGEDEPLFLTIDHIDNDGCLHRREKGRSSHNNIYGWLVRQGFPTGFQTLCLNCNQGKHRNGGICPHVTKVQRSSREGVGSSDPKRSAPPS